MIKRLSMILVMTIMVSIGAVAQDDGPVFAPAYLFGGAGHSDAAKVFMVAGYARKTALFNGSTNFPTYNYWSCQAYRAEARQFTDCSTGLLYPFYAKRLLGFDVKLAVAGDVGLSTAPGNVGYSIGARVVADIGRSAWKNWGFFISADPHKSSIGGVETKRVVAGARLAFGGF